MIIANFSYQGTVGLFVTLGTILVIKYSKNIKDFIKILEKCNFDLFIINVKDNRKISIKEYDPGFILKVVREWTDLGIVEFSETIGKKKSWQSSNELGLTDYYANDLFELAKVNGFELELIFKTKNKNQFFFIVIPSEERFDEKNYRTKYELPKISMASKDDLKELLNTHSEAVSIMELINDTNNAIKLFIDEKILNEQFFRFHPNENNSTVRISMQDLKDKLIPYLKHEINVLFK